MTTEATEFVGGDPIEYRSTDGREVRVEFGPYSFSAKEAREAAADLARAAVLASGIPSQHERHVNLLASCPLCVHEAGGQLDRLVWEDR